MADQQRCGKWMPRAKAYCARRAHHADECRTAAALADTRARKTARRVGQQVDPAARRRWYQAYRLSRYGLTQDDFDRLLELQAHACAMCHEPFAERKAIFIDHDHECCPAEKSSCGKCVRGLLDLSCNTTLGHIERRYDLARAYLDAPPGHSLIRVERVA